MDDLLKLSLNLKSKMLASDKKSEAAKQRDYKYHRKEFKNLIDSFGYFFYKKEENI